MLSWGLTDCSPARSALHQLRRLSRCVSHIAACIGWQATCSCQLCSLLRPFKNCSGTHSRHATDCTCTQCAASAVTAPGLRQPS